jgi:hypothetical protein
VYWRFMLVTAAGCGRLAFDAPASAPDAVAADARVCVTPVGHDEDLDGVDDACDVCPHLVDDQPGIPTVRDRTLREIAF